MPLFRVTKRLLRFPSRHLYTMLAAKDTSIIDTDPVVQEEGPRDSETARSIQYRWWSRQT